MKKNKFTIMFMLLFAITLIATSALASTTSVLIIGDGLSLVNVNGEIYKISLTDIKDSNPDIAYLSINNQSVQIRENHAETLLNMRVLVDSIVSWNNGQNGLVVLQLDITNSMIIETENEDIIAEPQNNEESDTPMIEENIESIHNSPNSPTPIISEEDLNDEIVGVIQGPGLPIASCYDSDFGKNEFVKGKVKTTFSTARSIKEDMCINDKFLREVYCGGNTVKSTLIKCANGCFDGTCSNNEYEEVIDSPYSLASESEITAFDSDAKFSYESKPIQFPITEQKNPELFKKGYGTGIYAGGSPNSHNIFGQEPNPTHANPTDKPYTTYYDHCANDYQLNEAFVMEDGELGAMGVNCPNGCKNGRCVSVSEIVEPEEESTVDADDTEYEVVYPEIYEEHSYTLIDLTSGWNKIEENTESYNFMDSIKPKFNIDENGDIAFDAGQVKKTSDYRGYYFKPVVLDSDFKLSFLVRIDSGFADSNCVALCLSNDKDAKNYVAQNNEGERVFSSDGFCFKVHSGRSSFLNFDGLGNSAPGYAYIASRLFGFARDEYYDVNTKGFGENFYGYEYSPSNIYQVVMQRVDEILSTDIYDKDSGEIVYTWKIKGDSERTFDYLSFVINNFDDMDSFGSRAPIGEIYDMKLQINGQTSTDYKKEIIKCVFDDSIKENNCYSEFGSCSGTNSCEINIKGQTGKVITWKSSCGGYVHTVIDGKDEYAKFSCSEVLANTCKDSDGGKNYYKFGTTEGLSSADNSQVKKQDYCNVNNKNLVEYSCSNGEVISSEVQCSQGCNNGACIKSSCSGVMLNSFPKMFLNENYLPDVTIVLGQTASTNEVISGVDLSAFLSSFGSLVFSDEMISNLDNVDNELALTIKNVVSSINDPNFRAKAVLDTEITSSEYDNLIIIGTKDGSNTLVTKIMQGEEKTLKKGQAFIELFNKNDNYQLVIVGYDKEETMAAVKIMINVLSNNDNLRAKKVLVEDGVIIKTYDSCEPVNELVLIKNTDNTRTSLSKTNNLGYKKAEKIEVNNDKKTEVAPITDMNCQGCVQETSCFPFGTRIILDDIAMFCDLDRSFSKQKSEEITCQNNYECTTNSCASGQCTDMSGLLEKFIKLFKFW